MKITGASLIQLAGLQTCIEVWVARIMQLFETVVVVDDVDDVEVEVVGGNVVVAT
jgi:hypothetical protein